MKKPIPRISTRGYYNRENGKAIKNNKYFLYPKKSFSKIVGKKEITIMIHGLRNDSQSAVNKFEIASLINVLWFCFTATIALSLFNFFSGLSSIAVEFIRQRPFTLFGCFSA